MKIPPNMTEQEVLDTMNLVINRIAPKYTFYGYDVYDIKQESYIICLEALDRHDGIRPLENFLSVNLSNRLKNFIRDNHFITDTNSDRIKIMQPVQLDYEDNLVDSNEKYSIDEERIDKEDYTSCIDRHLPASLRMDYLKLLNNVYITRTRRDEVINKITEILEEAGYEKRKIL
jgi:DNA-directed RNA polymerase specialized sigma24 family protein